MTGSDIALRNDAACSRRVARYVLAVVALGFLTGCGGDGTGPMAARAESTASRSIPPTIAPTLAALKETCAEVELALPKGAVDTYDDARMLEFLERIADLNNAADTETRNALRPLMTPAAELAGGGGAEAHLAFLDALDGLANRCRIAGSSALQ
jgi:hypothetical protein